MSFSVWFRQWINSFFKLLTIGSKKHKSDAQRKKERERRLKAKHSSANLYRIKKKRRRRRSSHAVQNERLIGALFKFMATSLGILLLPLGLFDWGRKSAKVRRASGRGAKRGTSTKKAAPSTNNVKKTTSSATKPITPKPTTKKPAPKKPAVKTTVNVPPTKTTPQEPVSYNYTPIFERTEPQVVTPVVEESVVTEPDENTPKSTPKNEKDQYIRKRMIIAGSYYCDKAVLDMLEVGSHIDLEAEPDNPYDKDAVKLLFNGQKIGYIAKKDHMAFVTCLRLKRKIYGVITAIIEEDGQTKYEFETWFDSVR